MQLSRMLRQLIEAAGRCEETIAGRSWSTLCNVEFNRTRQSAFTDASDHARLHERQRMRADGAGLVRGLANRLAQLLRHLQLE
jgi:hypothetical protein